MFANLLVHYFQRIAPVSPAVTVRLRELNWRVSVVGRTPVIACLLVLSSVQWAIASIRFYFLADDNNFAPVSTGAFVDVELCMLSRTSGNRSAIIEF